jgi:hypothetical protein
VDQPRQRLDGVPAGDAVRFRPLDSCRAVEPAAARDAARAADGGDDGRVPAAGARADPPPPARTGGSHDFSELFTDPEGLFKGARPILPPQFSPDTPGSSRPTPEWRRP